MDMDWWDWLLDGIERRGLSCLGEIPRRTNFLSTALHGHLWRYLGISVHLNRAFFVPSHTVLLVLLDLRQQNLVAVS